LQHYGGWDLEKIVANSLFADGAAALVGRAADPQQPAGWHVVAHGSLWIRDTEGAMSWPTLIRQSLGPWLTGWLGRHGLSADGVGSWAIHPGGPRILDTCRDALGLSESQLSESRRVLAEFGNMSSATVFFIIDRLRRAGGALPCVVLGFGSGMAVEAALIA
jgi:predicted naringenin-chalcone synthase